MKKTLYFDSFCGYYIAAVAEDGKIIDFDFEKRSTDVAVGNVYKGRVESVLPGMRAAFVNCGLKKNCYLSAEEFFPDMEKYLGGEPLPAMPDLHVGDELLVQVVKLPVGNRAQR